MAPSNMTNGNVGNRDSRRPKARPAVVPAIPLPYIQQQQQRRNKTPATPSPVTPGRPPSTPPTSTSVMTSPDQSEATSGTGDLSPVKELAPKERVLSGQSGHSKENMDMLQPHHHEPAPMLTSAARNGELGPDQAAVEQGFEQLAIQQEDPSGQSQHSTAAEPCPIQGPSRPSAAVSVMFGLPDIEYDGQFWADLWAGITQPTVTWPGMPTRGPPAGRGPSAGGSAAGNMLFGGVQDSNKTSPAPHSSGMFPPPHMGPHQPYSSAPFDWGPFPPPGMAANNGYPPMAPAFHPPSPQGFHGSQSSMHAEENGGSFGILPNGVNAGPVNHNGIPPPARPVRPMPPIVTPDPKHRAGVLKHLQDTYSIQEFADCRIEFRFAADPARSFVFEGHRAILANSPTLLQLFRQQPSQGQGRLMEHVLTVADPYVTIESLQEGLRAMYGHPMRDTAIRGQDGQVVFDLGLSGALAFLSTGILLGVPYICQHALGAADFFICWGNVERALDYCLSGAINLHVPAMDGSLSPLCPEAAFKHGAPADELIRSLMQLVSVYISVNMPARFVVDPTVQAPAGYARFPFLEPPSASSAPAIAHGSSGRSPLDHHFAQQGPAGRRSADPRLSQIRFGDLSPPTANGDVSVAVNSAGPVDHRNDGAPAITEHLYFNLNYLDWSPLSPPSRKPISLDSPDIDRPPRDDLRPILSRILLNLPHDYLHFVLTHVWIGSSETGMQMPYDERYDLMQDVVAKREVQRRKALDEVMTKRPKGWESILARLECEVPFPYPGPRDGAGDVLGWAESVPPNCLRIRRNWTPVRSTGS